MKAANLLPGTGIDGFVVGELLHAGGMGRVYRVTRPDLALPLVMKVPILDGEGAGERMLGFQTEATLLPTLSGPHVPRFVAAGDVARLPYIVVEWIEGRTLEQRLAGGALPVTEVVAVGAAIADALHDLHQQGVIHHDLKPANVIVRPDGSVVLIDFGLAHHERYPDLLAEQTRFGAGSAPYVSPEQLLGTRKDHRSDLFALGVTLYEALTLELPFGEPDTDVRNRFWLDPEPPSVKVPDLPPWLQEIVLRCLEPRAELRYQTAAHLAFELRHPEQVELTFRAEKSARSGATAHVRRFFRARAELGARLQKPPPLEGETPVVLVAVDTEHWDDERRPALYAAVASILERNQKYRLLCLTVIPPSASAQEHLARLRSFAEPLGLPAERLSLHAFEATSPAQAIVELAAHNSADLLVLGAPSKGGRAWSQSVASAVAANAPCSVYVIRVRNG